MPNDIPFIASAEEEESEKLEGTKVVRGEQRPASPASELTPEEKFHRLLMNKGVWADAPCVPQQEYTMPDTVRTLGVEVRTLDPSDTADAKLYGEIIYSNEIGGRYSLVKHPKEEFNRETGRFLCLVIFKTRQFKVPPKSDKNAAPTDTTTNEEEKES